METIEDASTLECLMLDISPDANLNTLFRHLENNRFSEMTLGKEKARGKSGSPAKFRGKLPEDCA